MDEITAMLVVALLVAASYWSFRSGYKAGRRDGRDEEYWRQAGKPEVWESIQRMRQPAPS